MIRAPRSLAPVFVVLVLGVAGCGRSAPATVPAPVRAAATPPTHLVDRLRAELASTFQSSAASALWAVKVQSLESGEVLFEQNAHTLVMPASNMKIVTMAVAVERLGWDYRFPTTIETASPIDNGVLHGDLVIVGHGDPSIRDGGSSPTKPFDEWADKLRGLGVQRVEGRLIGDDDAFDDEGWGSGWAWDDLSAGYAAPVGALQFNENMVSFVVRTPGQPGEMADPVFEPSLTDLVLRGAITIGPTGSDPDVFLTRRGDIVTVAGSVPRAERNYVRTLSVPNPTTFYLDALRKVLVSRNIAIARVSDIDDARHSGQEVLDDPKSRRVLFTHLSPPLSEMAIRFMKVSQNLYGETLLTSIGLQAGLEPCPDPYAVEVSCRGRATEAARKVYEEVLGAWGVPVSEFIIGDGSGLSRYDYLTANLLVTVLRRMARDPRHAALFDAALPIMGKDGTLARRLRGTRAEGNVHAKTGSISNVRALSGYLTTAGGERLVFSIVANNFKAPSAVIDGIADQAIERLVSFRR